MERDRALCRFTVCLLQEEDLLPAVQSYKYREKCGRSRYCSKQNPEDESKTTEKLTYESSITVCTFLTFLEPRKIQKCPLSPQSKVYEVSEKL